MFLWNVNFNYMLLKRLYKGDITVFTDSQPSTSNLTWATLQEHCRSGNGSQIRLNKSNISGSQTELLIRPMWSSVDGNYTPWIAYQGI